MRLCAILEAWVQLVFQGGKGRALPRIPQKVITELDIIKWPLPGRNLERAGEFGQKPRFNGQNRGLELKGPLC